MKFDKDEGGGRDGWPGFSWQVDVLDEMRSDRAGGDYEGSNALGWVEEGPGVG